jgi:hypothetical protein
MSSASKKMSGVEKKMGDLNMENSENLAPNNGTSNKTPFKLHNVLVNQVIQKVCNFSMKLSLFSGFIFDNDFI